MIDKPFWGLLIAKGASPQKHAFLLLCVLASLLLAACQRTISKDEMLEGMSEESRRAMDSMVNTPFIVEGVASPEFVSAADAGLQDTNQVIGIVMNGQARAYPLARVSAMMDHVVNDNVSTSDGKNSPFTITYCDMTDCIRVLESTDPTSRDTLEIGTLGLLDRGLALQWKGKTFKQMESIDGLKDVPYRRMSWGEWKAEYPDTMVYKGRPQRKP
jgi:hypothetical protein